MDELHALTNHENEVLWRTLKRATDKVKWIEYGDLYGELLDLRTDLTTILIKRSAQ